MERTIRVTGKGNVSIKPDQIRMMIDLEGIKKSYEETLQLSAESVENLKKLFISLGFEGKDLKTTYFNVDTKYESYQARDKSWQKRFLGYEYKHKLKIEFDADNKLLGKVLFALAHMKETPEFRIVYTVKDPEASKNLLLGNAVADSKEKAKVLTEAAGVSLGDIITIDYSWGEIEFTNSPVREMLSPSCCDEDSCIGSYDIDIEPDDIEVADTVTVVWRIA